MATQAATLLATAAANGYSKLSQRDIIRCLSYLYANAQSLSMQSALNLAIANGYQKLSEEDLLRCWLAAECSGTCNPASLLQVVAANKYPTLSERQIWDCLLACTCASNCNAADLENASRPWQKVSDLELLQIILVGACSSGCNAATLEALATSLGYRKLSYRGILECLLAACTSAGGGSFSAPTAFSFAYVNGTSGGATAVASFTAPPAGATGTEVWVSTDGVTYVLLTTVAGPGTSTAPFFLPIEGVDFCKVRYVSASVQGTFTAPLFLTYRVGSWAAQIIVNGGAAISQNTMDVTNVLIKDLLAAGLVAKTYILNTYAPDNATAAKTSVIPGPGRALWIAAGALTLDINGIAGGAGAWLLTGFIPSTMLASGFDVSLIAYNYDPTGVPTTFAMGAGNSPFTEGYDMLLEAGGNSQGDASYNSGAGRITTGALNAGWNGYNCITRTAANLISFYQANSVTPHNLYASNAAVTVDGKASVTVEILTHAFNLAGTPIIECSLRFSCFGIGLGLSAADSLAYYNAIQACRVGYGGGFR